MRKKVLIVGWGTETAKYVLKECVKLEKYNFYLAATSEKISEVKKFFGNDRIIITNPYDEVILCEDIEKYCQVNGVYFDIVTTFFEMCVYQTAFLAEYLGIENYLPVKSALKTSVNKYLMRLSLQKYGLKQPVFFKFSKDSTREAFKFFKRNFKRAVIKPIHSGHSYGVRFLEGEIKFDTFKKYVDQAISDYDENYDEWMKYEDAENLEFLLEEFIEGKIFSFDGFVKGNNKVNFIGTTEFDLSKPPIMQQIGHTSPIYSLSKRQISNGKKYVSKVVKILGLKYCGFHCELKFCGKNPCLIEISGRLPGAIISKTYQDLSKYNLFDRFFGVFSGNKKFVENKDVFKSESMKIIFSEKGIGVVKNTIKDKLVGADFSGEIRSRRNGEVLLEENNPFGIWLYDINVKSKKLLSNELVVLRDNLIKKQKIMVYKSLYFYMSYFLDKIKRHL
jgi:biotin carboxylase